MSQEINLLNPALRPKTDWLAFRPVAAAAAAVLLLVVAGYAYAAYRAGETARERGSVAGRLSTLQQELQGLQAALAERKPNPALAQEIGRLSAEIAQRRQVLKLAQETAVGGEAPAELMRGFSRQITEGVWLTGFAVAAAGIDIRGRLLDPALLPAYIRRLNGEPAFRGRRFAALDLQAGVVLPPAAVGGQSTAAPPAAAAAAPFTEFVLRASMAPPAAGSKE